MVLIDFSFWLPEYDYPDLMNDIIMRVDHMTNLDQTHTEMLQVC